MLQMKQQASLFAGLITFCLYCFLTFLLFPKLYCDLILSIKLQLFRQQSNSYTMNIILNKRLPSAGSKRQSADHSARKNKQETALDYFIKGKNKQNQGQILEALECYLKATIYNSNYFEAFCNMGSCYRSLGKYAQSKNCYLHSLKISPKDAITTYNLANLYRIIGDYQEAIKEYSLLIKWQQVEHQNLGNLYINTLINTGICYRNLGLYQEAIRIYEKVNLLAPLDEGGFYNHGMNILSLIQKNTAKKVTNFDKLLADRASLLFEKVQILNPSNKMVKIAKIKLRLLVNRVKQTYDLAFQQLKILKFQPGFENLAAQLLQAQDFCANLFQQKKNPLQNNFSKSQPQNNYDIEKQKNNSNNLFSKFLQITENYLSVEYLTEQKGIEMIEKGQYAQLSNQLKNIDDKNKMKHTLQLMLHLQKSKINNKFVDKAYQIYKNYFTLPKTGQCIPFDQISSKGHQALGKLFNLKQNYSEATLHFQYCSNMIKQKSQSSAAQHHQIAEGFEAAGSMIKAIEQYHLAFQLQPNNQKIAYNLGCCLFQNGRYEESLQYFQIFLQNLEQKSELNQEQKQIWQTQCLILIALAADSGPQQLKSFQKAYNKLKELRRHAGEPQIQQQHLLTFFQNFATILENQFAAKNSQKLNCELQQLLIEVYTELLSFSNCVDREVIIINIGNLAYQSGNYLQAVQNYLQIKTTVLIPYQKIALCYLRLIEPIMTLKYIQLQVSINKNSKRAQFIKEMIEWIYYNENVGNFNSKLPAVKQDYFYERNQFGIGLIDKFEYQIKTKKLQSTLVIQNLIDELLRDPRKLMFQESWKNKKFDKVKQLLTLKKPQQQQTSSLLNENILQVCFNGGQDIRVSLSTILNFLNNLPYFGGLTNLTQALLHIYIYQNQKNSHTMKDLFLENSKSSKKLSKVNIDKISKADQQFLSIDSNFDSLKEFVFLLSQWEESLSPKINSIVELVSNVYYQTEIAKCFEIQHNFPRHCYLSQCDQTFNKIVIIAMKVLKYDKKCICNGSTIQEMKKELIIKFQYQFNYHIKSLKLKPICLNEHFVPLTLYAYHKSKLQSEKFIKSVLQLGSQGQQINEDYDEYQIVINNLVKVRCRWGNPFSNNNIITKVMRKIVQNPLYIANQSLIELQKLLQIIKTYCPNAQQVFKQDNSLHF